MNLQEAYEKMQGNYDDVMGRLPREESVIKFLKKFLENQDFQNMLAAAKENRYQDVFVASHNLKGMCGNLGLSLLADSTSRVCEMVRNGDPAEDLTPYIEKAKADYALVITTIGQL